MHAHVLHMGGPGIQAWRCKSRALPTEPYRITTVYVLAGLSGLSSPNALFCSVLDGYMWVRDNKVFRVYSPNLFCSFICFLLAGLPFAILTPLHNPFKRGFFCNDDSIKYPLKEDTISYQLLGGVMIPIIVLTVSAPVFMFTR